MLKQVYQRDIFTSSSAIYGGDGKLYRYELLIEWDPGKPRACVIGLNPSTATERSNDPTIERLERWARRSGHGSLGMYNAYGLRSTDPNGLWESDDPLGPDNDTVLMAMMRYPGVRPVAAWGANIELWRQLNLKGMAARCGASLQCWGLTAEGFPRHPLYLSDETLDSPEPFTGRTER